MKYTKTGIEVDGKTYTLEEIKKGVAEVRASDPEMAILELTWDSSRGFDGVHEQRYLKLSDINRIVKLIKGKKVCFGEIAGKHSDVFGDIDEDDISINQDKEYIKNYLERHNNGVNFNYSFIAKILEKSCYYYEDDEDYNENQIIANKEDYIWLDKVIYKD